LPLIAIQKSEIYINVTFRKLRELYTVIDYTGVPGGTGYRVRPDKTNHYIGNFIKYNPSPDIAGQNYININPLLEINNIFLDNEERKRFALSSHDYLITQVQAIRNTYGTGKSIIFDLKNINKPVTELIFMIRRSDIEDVNDWTNYTNWNMENIPPYSTGYYNKYGPSLTINTNNIKYYKNKNLLKSGNLRIQTQSITESSHTKDNDEPTPNNRIIDGKDFIFYNLMQNFNSNVNMPDEGIYSYSFSLDNSSIQPIGAINMSSINNKDIILNLTDINTINGGYNYPSGTTYNYIVYVFAVNYEILKILGGMAGTMTSN